MTFSPWWRLVVRNRFSISPSRWGLAFTITSVSLLNSMFSVVQRVFLERKLKMQSMLWEPPLFILGHWRSGTTYLHELLVLDPAHNFPTTFECLSPRNSLLLGGFFTRWMRFLLPARRPMDNVATGWERPQEDEFALCNIGLPSPYRTIAFPNRPPQDQEYLDFQGVPREDIERWKQGLRWFLERVALRRPGRRIVLKSPTHTGRVRVLLEMFPDARFIHIVRDPFELFASTVKLWKSLPYVQGLQVPRYEGIEQYVLRTLERMYAQFERDRQLIDPSRFYEVRYEDLVRDPIGQVQAMYEHLGLGNFEQARPQLEAYLASLSDYQRNRHPEIAPELRAEIIRRWGPYFRRYGYLAESPLMPTCSR